MKALSLAVLSLVAVLIAIHARADVLLYEDLFEYTDSPLDHGWEIVPTQGVESEFFTATGLKSGERHLQMQRNSTPMRGMRITHDLG